MIIAGGEDDFQQGGDHWRDGATPMPELATRPTTSAAWRAPGTGCGRPAGQPTEPRHKRGTTMNIDVLAIAGIALLLIFRLERLGKQIEAVRYELMPDARRRDELAQYKISTAQR
jgi:hypothetical protein